MTSQTPSHLVLVRGSACLQCRRKKRRCDAAKPRCGPCKRARSSSDCTYNPTTSADGSEAQATGSGETGSTSQISPKPGARRPLHALGSGPLDGPNSLRDPFAGLFKEKDMLTNIRDPLIDVFLKYSWIYFAEWNIDRFWVAYKLPPSHPQSIHPALLDAMCLLGCIQTRHVSRAYEPLFRARLQRSLHDCLAAADRLLDFIRASTMAAAYSLLKGRHIDGQNRFAVIAQFAMACGLHQIDTYDLPSLKLLPLLKKPKDLIELGDMIYTWWCIFCGDRIGALLANTPSTIPHNDKTITTMWPCLLSDYANGRAAHTPYSGLSVFQLPDHGLNAISSAYENVTAFRAKGFALLYYATFLREGPDTANEVRAAIRAASLLADSIVSYRNLVCPNFDRAQNREDPSHDNALILALTLAYASIIQLLHTFSNNDVGVYKQRLEIAQTCARLGVEATRVNLDLLNVIIWLPWASAYEVLAWEYIRLCALKDTEGAAAIRVDLDGMMDSLQKFAGHYTFKTTWPFQQLKRFNIHSAQLTGMER
ncbi:hypothetical protein BOTBODRAFT_27581 [Botryobasidium botryosum FD-172 SS1]|uniref:Zn(2)-C6 fungal-type domain-containing protein n=1 Tax=Botryobasidium botryosum (strain FD-172 SS1) TaxID=930990 RepID=A0A067MWP9_BOTB1|nr:hypothetical protein BOTBODRAFT_27581 [Botryobasidium botryosum FD-172 SS1]